MKIKVVVFFFLKKKKKKKKKEQQKKLIPHLGKETLMIMDSQRRYSRRDFFMISGAVGLAAGFAST
ncbi:hypothetical protein BT093_11675, partial [Corynebacterium diphtheriae]